MKTTILIPALLLVCSFRPLPKKYQGMTKSEIETRIDSLKTRSSAVVKPNSSALELENRKLKIELARKDQVNQFSPTLGREFGAIATFERFNGIIDGNIVSSGQPVNFKVDFKAHRKIPNGSYLSCTGTNLASKYNYRIIAFCDRLITKDDEFEVSVGIKDTKKIDGISPDFVYTGEEEAILGEGFSAIMSGIIDSRKERERTTVGFAEVPNAKNSLLGGLIKASELANSKAKEESQKTNTVLAVEDRKEVIIEFKRRFSYEK